jgi:hypothetical protein
MIRKDRVPASSSLLIVCVFKQRCRPNGLLSDGRAFGDSRDDCIWWVIGVYQQLQQQQQQQTTEACSLAVLSWCSKVRGVVCFMCVCVCVNGVRV